MSKDKLIELHSILAEQLLKKVREDEYSTLTTV